VQPLTLQLIQQLKQGDRRALARLITYVENRHEDLLEIMLDLSKSDIHPSQKIGITGPPGAGKSTFVDRLIRAYRLQNKTVGVVAIDPSSPFSGGAVLGDRIRMQEHNADAGVFIRSVGSRGAHGGLSLAAQDIVLLMQVFGFDVILVETVGVGQTELDIMTVADTTIVVLVPESGDTIQTMKAGLMEIADIFVVNKSDRDGADKILHELQALSHMHSGVWSIPVLKTVATRNSGFPEVLQVISDHTAHVQKTGDRRLSKLAIHQKRCLDIISAELLQKISSHLPTDASVNCYESAKNILQKIRIVP